jgi:hypothetical protein
VLVLMHRDYVRPGRLPLEMGRILSTLSDLRNIGDYGGVAHVSPDEAHRARIEAQQFLPTRHRPSPYPKRVGTWHMFPQNDFYAGVCFRGCRQFFMFRPPSLLTTRVVPTVGYFYPGPSWLLRPRISRFVTSPSSGYANRPNRAIDGRGTFTLQDLRPCRLLGQTNGIFALPSRQRTPQRSSPVAASRSHLFSRP